MQIIKICQPQLQMLAFLITLGKGQTRINKQKNKPITKIIGFQRGIKLKTFNHTRETRIVFFQNDSTI